MAAVNDVAVRITVNGQQLEHVLDGINARMGEMNQTGTKTGGGLSGSFNKAHLAFLAISAALGGVILGLNAVVGHASDMNEEVAKMNVVFAGVGDKAFQLRDKLRDSFSLSYAEATKLMARTGDLMTGFGATRDKAADLAFSVNALAADMVSFKNIEGGVEGASDAITKAMMGERESAKQLGIVIRETDIQARLAAEGKNKLTGNARNLAIAETTLSMIYEQQKNAIGDLERTQFSFANQQRQAAAAMSDIGLAIGATLLPLWNKLIIEINNFLKTIDPGAVAGVLNASYEVIKIFVLMAIEQFKVMWESLKLMAAGVVLMMNKNFAGAAALMGGAVGMMVNQAETGWEKMGEAARKGYDEGVAMFKDFINGQRVAESDNRKQSQDEQSKGYEAWLKTLNEQDKKAVEDWMKLQTEAGDWQAEQDNLAMEREFELNNQRAILEENARISKQVKEIKDTADRAARIQKLKILEQQSFQASISASADAFRAFSGNSVAAFNIWKGLAIAEAVIDSLQASSRALKDYMFPWSLIIAASAFAKGMAIVSQIRSQKFQKYALGGIVDRPTAGIIGEAGDAEIIAPKKTFIDVTNELINKGMIGGDSGIVVRKLDKLNRNISNLRLVADFDDDRLALRVERGNQILTNRDY
jgi:hypothetical protein